MARQATPEELLILRAYQRQVERLRQSEIIQSGRVTFKYTTQLTFPTGEIATSFAGYDPVEFQSVLPVLRQFLLQQDAINFLRLHNLLNQCCDRPELLAWVRHARREWMKALSSLPIGEHRYFHDAKDDVEAAVQKLFYGYGGLFHVDLNQPQEANDVREIQEATLQHAFPRLWNCLHTVDSVIHIWLDEPNKPVPQPPAP